MAVSRLRGLPLAAWERDGLKTALRRVGLPADDIEEPQLLFWRYETLSDVPVGFGGLEIHDRNALLRSVVTLPPLRHAGMGRAIVAALEAEAAAHQCESVYLLTTEAEIFFSRLGYQPCARERIPATLRASRVFASPSPTTATAMTKAL
jgi:N-acetylglutamate synthase-like GNAT family acetyltransferase